jgi:hypothetical protein
MGCEQVLAAVLLDLILPGQAGQARAMLVSCSIAGDKASEGELPLKSINLSNILSSVVYPAGP